jgi:acyl-CoA reductase-like NAD-dependent aldehyde dehydrogenase
MTELVTSFIAGRFADGAGAERLPVINPHDESVVAELAEADAAEVDRAVAAARTAFARGEWARASVAQRQQVLRRIAELIREREDELVRRELANTGIPVRQIRERHVKRAAMNFAFFADYIGQAANESYEQEAPFLTIVRREPVGVAALVAPWNAPLALATMEMAGALAFGNCCILKPSELTPLEFVTIMEIARDAGVPEGVIGLINGRGPVTGQALVAHPGVDVVAFIGGTETGRHIARAAGGNLKKYVAELGGKSANIVTASADHERALDAALVSIYSNNGQQCLAGSRILVEESIAEDSSPGSSRRAQRLRLGDPADPATEIGPVISRGQYDACLRFAGRRGRAARRARAPRASTRATTSPRPSPALTTTAAAVPGGDLRALRDLSHLPRLRRGDRHRQRQRVRPGRLFVEQRPADVMARPTGSRQGRCGVNTPVARDLRAPFGRLSRNSGVGRTGGHSSRALFTRRRW